MSGSRKPFMSTDKITDRDDQMTLRSSSVGTESSEDDSRTIGNISQSDRTVGNTSQSDGGGGPSSQVSQRRHFLRNPWGHFVEALCEMGRFQQAQSAEIDAKIERRAKWKREKERRKQAAAAPSNNAAASSTQASGATSSPLSGGSDNGCAASEEVRSGEAGGKGSASHSSSG